MNFPKYDGNIHPDEWINNIKKCIELDHMPDYDHYLRGVISLVDSNNISLPAEINSFEELRNALKEDISFIVFKCTNKRLLQSLKYVPEREGGNTSKFVLNFRKLCYNAEINDIEEQKNYFCNTLPKLPNNINNNSYNYFLEFIKRREKIKSMNDLIKEFAEIVTDELDLIKRESIVALKHVATGKYLSSIENLCYTTGSRRQLVFAGSPEPGLNALWKIRFNEELAIYNETYIDLQHVKSDKYLGLYYNYNCHDGYTYYKSPKTEHTEEIEEIGRISTEHNNNQEIFLRSHDIQFTIGNDSFQEVVCHNERLGGNDEWRIELIQIN
ncbi:hypothetical protein GLOIN_2v1473636 [Rhizophagus clarus]|uniref:MIR domain-containing protein n=1 Tax=Rhizophagus clarus TaxID=94130 RepID=A0A8H3LZR4_9GLOM|nr:hypothetical protein GLOIN_2v1473636 [Rhizophagus clarus]